MCSFIVILEATLSFKYKYIKNGYGCLCLPEAADSDEIVNAVGGINGSHELERLSDERQSGGSGRRMRRAGAPVGS